MRTLRFRMLVFAFGIVTLTTTVIAVMVQRKAEQALQNTLEENALNLLASTRNFVEMEHKSIVYYKTAVLDRRKAEIRNLVDMAYSLVITRYNQYLSGKLTEQDAQMSALSDIEMLRYDGGVGYFWVNNTDKENPTLIMHPTMPALEGKTLLSPEYNCVIDTNQNLFHAFIDICRRHGEGYVHYRWPKPTPIGLTEEQPKVSYVRMFQPWNFIIGTGVYVDDIEKEAAKRVDAVITELNDAISKQKIGDEGYFFIFNEKNIMLVHPNMVHQDLSGLRDATTGESLVKKMKAAAFTPSKSMVYLWDKDSARGVYKYEKKIFVTHFPPLGWYIAVSIYKDDFEKRVTALTNSIIWFSMGIIVLSLLLAGWLARSFSGPLLQLARAVSNTGVDGLPIRKMDVKGADEIITLTNTINHMIDSIKVSKANLQESEKRFRSIFEAAGESIWLISTTDNTISEFNTAAYESLGYSRDEFASMSISALLMGEVDEEKYIEAVEGDTVSHFESVHRGKGNTPHNVLVTCRNIQVENHNYNLVVVRDITEKTRMEQLMVQSEKMMSVGGLAAGLAHEINNPLAGILQNAELLKSRLVDDTPKNKQIAAEEQTSFEAVQRYLQRHKVERLLFLIANAGTRAAQIVRDMLSFARQEGAESQWVRLQELVDRTVLLAANDFDFKENFDFRKIRIIREYDDTLGAVRCYPSKIQQVLLNILQNGADAMRNKTYIENEAPTFLLRVTTEGEDWAVIQIQDNGVGMPEVQTKRVFEPFFSTKGVGKGTGLGMSVSYFIISENHGGRLEVDSSPGQFTMFTIKLPYHS
ncbi:MAG: cache domain-containing protein [Deltaproteobacteria bacterium]|nr:cache domain-containing protein [Deltaproteobacteria bacterium]MBN2673994.1 cache domain-containing protein [Deltaproteobacteria bacterium]